MSKVKVTLKVKGPKPKSKHNETKICVDMMQSNQAIKRTKQIIPKIDDMIVDLGGTKVFKQRISKRQAHNNFG